MFQVIVVLLPKGAITEVILVYDLNAIKYLHGDAKFSPDFAWGCQILCLVGDTKNTEGVPKFLGDLTRGMPNSRWCRIPYDTGRSHITTLTGSTPNAYKEYLHIPDPQQWSFPLFSQMKTFWYEQQSSVTILCACNNCIIPHIALTILLLKKPSN